MFSEGLLDQDFERALSSFKLKTLVFQPFQVGDFIEAGGATGSVQEIQIFNTIMSSPDNKRIIVPNAKITSDKITVHPAPGIY